MSARRIAASIGWSVGLSVLVAVQGCTDTVTPAPPIPFRQRAPISNYRVPTSRPTFRWFTPHPELEHTVTICADRDCQRVEETLTVRGNNAQPRRDLPRGLHYWRVTSRWENADRATPVWQLRTTWDTHAEVRGADRGDAADYNGDGYSDIALITGNQSVEIVCGGEGSFTSGSIDPGASEVAQRSLSLLGAADLDGDGFDDLAVGIPGARRDQVVVYYGGREGLSSDRRAEISTGFPEGTWFVPTTVKSPRRADLNQDGFDDLLLRAGPAPNGAHYTLGSAVLWRERGLLAVGRLDGTPLSSPPTILMPVIPIDYTLDGLPEIALMSAGDDWNPGVVYDGPFPVQNLVPRTTYPVEGLRPFPLARAFTPLLVCDLEWDRIDDELRQRRSPESREQASQISATQTTARSMNVGSDVTCIGFAGREVLLYPKTGTTGFELRTDQRDFRWFTLTSLSFDASRWVVSAGQPLNQRDVRAGNFRSQSQQGVAFLIDGDRGTVLLVGEIGESSVELPTELGQRSVREFFL